ncbi:MAG TPA: sugar ABC transporter permease [Clostridia bacterium]|nr:sugar ABC transporter permease [Clostridia bacterium]
MSRSSFKRAESRLGFLFILPTLVLISSIIIYPICYNIYLSFHRVSLNPLKPHKFVELKNYLTLLSDASFVNSLLLTFAYVFTTVIMSTAVGLLIALLMNRKFKGRGIARSLVILPYVAPVISLVFVWQYMFNGIYGIVNYVTVDMLHLFNAPPAWFDHPVLSMALVVLFDTWRVFPYSFMMILAAMQAIDDSLYEAADIDGANSWRKFRAITMPEILPVVGSLVVLRSIWNFYKFDDVYLLTKQVPIMGVYLYETAFSVNDYGLAAAITVILFIIVMTMVFLMRRGGLRR